MEKRHHCYDPTIVSLTSRFCHLCGRGDLWQLHWINICKYPKSAVTHKSCHLCGLEFPWRLLRPKDQGAASFEELRAKYEIAVYENATTSIPYDLAILIAAFTIWEGPSEGMMLDVVYKRTGQVYLGLVTNYQKGEITIRYIGWDKKETEKFEPDSPYLFPRHYFTDKIVVSPQLFLTAQSKPQPILRHSIVVFSETPKTFLIGFVEDYYEQESNASGVWISVNTQQNRPLRWVHKKYLSVLTLQASGWSCVYCSQNRNTALWCRECGAIANLFE